jgi:hypothetical protein
LGEVVDGRFGAFNFEEVGFGRTTALEKADRRLWVYCVEKLSFYLD